LNPTELNYLSLVDISVDVYNKFNGFYSGDVFKRSLLGNHITGMHESTKCISTNLLKTLVYNIANNPLCLTYKTLCEISGNPNVGIPTVHPSMYKHFTKQIIERSPLFGVIGDVAVQRLQLGVLMETDTHMFNPLYNTPTFHVGDLVHRITHGSTSLVVGYTGMQLSLKGPSIEAAMFPYLFPQGIGFLNTKDFELMSYMSWRMHCLFSLFTMSKLYPIVMYMLRTSYAIKNQVCASFLEKEI